MDVCNGERILWNRKADVQDELTTKRYTSATDLTLLTCFWNETELSDSIEVHSATTAEHVRKNV